MIKVLSVENMRKSDAYTIENYISSKELMYKAGEGVFKSVKWRGRVAIVCGSGNNAGDGYVVANLLHEHNIPCTIFLIKEKFSEDGKFYFDKCVEAGINVENKNYTNDEVERFKIKVTDFIMSQSTKDIEKYSKKFSSLL